MYSVSSCCSIRYDKLSGDSKSLYFELVALSKKFGHCFASNSHLARKFNVSPRTISRWIRELIDHGYIYTIVEVTKNFNKTMNKYSENTRGFLRKIFITKNLKKQPSERESCLPSVADPGKYNNETEKECLSIDNACARDFVENVHKPEDEEKVSLPAALSTPSCEGNKRLREKRSVDIENPSVIEVLSREALYKPYLRPHMMVHWLKKWPPHIVLQALKCFLDVMQRNPEEIRKHEPWMEKCFKRETNRAVAKNAKQKLSWHALTIKDSYCIIKATGKELYFNNNEPEQFKQILIGWYKAAT